MKRISTWAAFGAVVCMYMAMPIAAKAMNKSKELEEALKAKYQVAHMGIDRLRITKPGTIMVIRKEGVRANPSIDMGNLTDKVIDGQVQGPKGFSAALFSNQRDQSLKAGTTVYITRINVRNKDVRFDVVTCDTSNIEVSGHTRYMRYAATLDFQFPQGFLETANADAIKKAVDPVLLPQDEVKAANTKTVQLGQTPEQVRAALGAPDTIIKLGAKEIFVYKGMKVIFKDGKVSDVR
jgi:hypothetical protein